MTGVFVIAVRHEIVRAEENHLQDVFGREYLEYCSRVRQYHLIRTLPGCFTGQRERMPA